jgi:hypothetical protein
MELRHVRFRPLETEDLKQLRDWRNDPKVRESFREYRPLNMQNQEKWFASLQDGRDIMFMVVCDKGDPVGVGGLCYIDQHNRHAELSYYVGDKVYSGKYDVEIINALVKYGFEEVGLHRISAECYAFATDRLSVIEECGFKRDGVMRDVVFRHGKFWDSIMLSILEGER